MAKRGWVSMRFARFVVAGSIAFCVDAAVLTVLVNLLGWAPTWSRCISFSVAVTINWLIHRHHVFEATDDPQSEYARFALVQLLSGSLNLGIYLALVVSVPTFGRWPVVPLTIGAAASMFFSYACATRFVFVRSAPQPRHRSR